MRGTLYLVGTGLNTKPATGALFWCDDPGSGNIININRTFRTGRQTFQLNGRVGEDQAGNELLDFTLGDSIQEQGYTVPYTLNLTVLTGADNGRMRAQLRIGPVDVTPFGSCDARTFETILTRR